MHMLTVEYLSNVKAMELISTCAQNAATIYVSCLMLVSIRCSPSVLGVRNSFARKDTSPLITVPKRERKWTNLLPDDHNVADTRHFGDLFFVRGRNVHTLSWNVDLLQNCDIHSILKNVNYFYEATAYCPYPHISRGSLCCNAVHLKLFTLKKLLPFDNTYIVAHIFFRLYTHYDRNFRRKYNRHISRVQSGDQNYSPEVSRFVNNFHGTGYKSTLKVSSDDNKWNFVSKQLIMQLIETCVGNYFKQEQCIKRFSQEVARERPIRSVVNAESAVPKKVRVKRSNLHFTDPLYSEQWHLHGSNFTRLHINVLGAWESGVTGQGVTVCVIDNGLEWTHPDIRNNYNKEASYDFNADDTDPSPAQDGRANEHGTRCAGEIAAVANDVCGVGVAYKASLSGIRVLGLRITDSMESMAFTHQLQQNYIYSCSWGPADDGRTVDGPKALSWRALRQGTTFGRGGRGAIYVTALGNGGVHDDCNYDGYANSIYTITVGAVDSDGRLPSYAERCAAMLAVAPSVGLHGKNIVTTDWHSKSTSGCTLQHSGSSAAAPLVAGVLALALQMQPCLGWKDVQYLLAITSRIIDPENPEWFTNSAGLTHSHTHGFGLVDAAAVVSLAAVWETLPFSAKFIGPDFHLTPEEGRLTKKNSSFMFNVSQDELDSFGLRTLETVGVLVWLQHEYRGSIGYALECPSGTKSIIAMPRPRDDSKDGLAGWMMTTVRCWGEVPAGTFVLTLFRDPNSLQLEISGMLTRWRLVLYGSSATPKDVSKRIRIARAAMRGDLLHVYNRSQLCHPTTPEYPEMLPVSPVLLKVLLFYGCCLAVYAVVAALEYAFCFNSEKRKFREALEQEFKARQTFGSRLTERLMATSRTSSDGRRDQNAASVEELESLLSRGCSRDRCSPSPSCDADQSASPDDGDDDFCGHHDDDDDGVATVLPNDTTDVCATTTDHYITTDVDDDNLARKWCARVPLIIVIPPSV